MKRSPSWNRREFIAKPAALLAASQLVGGTQLLFGQPASAAAAASPLPSNSKPIMRTLGKTGLKLPIVSMGVMNADVPGLLRRSYEVGIRYFDTAAVYQGGRNEEMVGRMIKEMGVRDKVVVSTKERRPGSGPGPQVGAQQRAISPVEVKASMTSAFEGSLRRLQTDYVDILLSHGCDSESDVTSEGALAALTELKKAGKARFIGMSTHQPEMALRLASKLGIYDVVLIQFNYTMAEDQGLLNAIDEAANKGIGVIAMKTQAGGSSRPDPKLGRLTPASQTALLKWVLHHESITTAIPGYTTYEQLEENFSVAFNLKNSPEEQEFISNKRSVAEAQFCRQCGQCRPDCPHGVDIPQLMRAHMYSVQYGNYALAAETMAAVSPASGLAACDNCQSCRVECRNMVNINKKIQLLKDISSIGRLSA